jgi:hypothetical protein
MRLKHLVPLLAVALTALFLSTRTSARQTDDSNDHVNLRDTRWCCLRER